MKLDPKSAAAVIRPLLAQHPIEDHRAADVCAYLEVEATEINLEHVAFLLGVAGVSHYTPVEYPMLLTRRDERGRIVPVVYPDGHPKQGLDVVFNSAEERAAYHAAASDH